MIVTKTLKVTAAGFAKKPEIWVLRPGGTLTGFSISVQNIQIMLHKIIITSTQKIC